MNTSAAGVAFICSWEKFASKPYPDAKRVWTIGYGHAMFHGITIPGPLTQDQAMALMREDLSFAEHSVSTLVKVPLSQNEFDALVSFVFNCGAANFASSFTLKLLNAGKRASAASRFVLWNECDGKMLAGLTARRQAEANMFTKNVYENHT